MTAADALRAYTSGVLLARAAYYRENACRCGMAVGFLPERREQRRRCADCKRAYDRAYNARRRTA